MRRPQDEEAASFQRVRARWIGPGHPQIIGELLKDLRHCSGSWRSEEEISLSAARMPWMCSLGFKEGKGS